MLGGLEPAGWKPVAIEAGRRLNEPVILFQRLDRRAAEEELQRLKNERQDK